MAESAWLKSFKARLNDDQAGPVEASPIESSPVEPKKRNNNAIFIGIVLITTFCLILAAFGVRKFVLRPHSEPEIAAENAPALPETPRVDSHTEEIAQLRASLDLAHDRLVVLGGLFNHNMNAVSQNAPGDIIYINQDWSIDQLPGRISDPNALSKYLKK